MATDIFVTVPGTVAYIEEKGTVLPGKIKFENSDELMFMISGVDYKQSVDAQFQTSLMRDIYAYVFGDNMGEVVLHGRAYYQCFTKDPEAFRSAASRKSTGLDDVMNMYADNKLSTRKTPVTLSLNNGKRVLKGYLTSILIKAVGLSDEPAGLVYDFSATISTVPSISNTGG